MSKEPELEYARILVPIFGEQLDDDIMSTAGQLASDRDSGGATIDAIYVHVIPMSLPLDAQLPEEQLEPAPSAALARAKQVGEEYEGVRGRTSSRCAAARMGSAIVEAARERAGRGDRDRSRAALAVSRVEACSAGLPAPASTSSGR